MVDKDELAYSVIARNVRICWAQEQINSVLKGIPFIILIGTAAAVYYPEPLLRTFGDIDIIVQPEHYEKARNAFVSADYKQGNEDSRHAHFSGNGVSVELHKRFAVLQTREQEELLDGWLFSKAPIEGKFDNLTFPMPDHELNGLVLLTHINQHLEEGLGLRQLIDFIMFVNSQLSDEQWPAFKARADQLGLTKLAKVVARLGQMYLGLTDAITWCRDVPASNCLMESIILI